MSEPYICGKYLEVRHCQSVAEIEVILVVSSRHKLVDGHLQI